MRRFTWTNSQLCHRSFGGRRQDLRQIISGHVFEGFMNPNEQHASFDGSIGLQNMPQTSTTSVPLHSISNSARYCKTGSYLRITRLTTQHNADLLTTTSHAGMAQSVEITTTDQCVHIKSVNS